MKTKHAIVDFTRRMAGRNAPAVGLSPNGIWTHEAFLPESGQPFSDDKTISEDSSNVLWKFSGFLQTFQYPHCFFRFLYWRKQMVVVVGRNCINALIQQVVSCQRFWVSETFGFWWCSEAKASDTCSRTRPGACSWQFNAGKRIWTPVSTKEADFTLVEDHIIAWRSPLNSLESAAFDQALPSPHV